MRINKVVGDVEIFGKQDDVVICNCGVEIDSETSTDGWTVSCTECDAVLINIPVVWDE